MGEYVNPARDTSNNPAPLQLDASSNLKVSGTIGLSTGTEVKVTDGTDDLEITATGAAKVDGSAVTQPISAASLPLPTGAATQATLATLFKPFDQAFVIPFDAVTAANLSSATYVLLNLYSSATTAVCISGTWSGVLEFEGSVDTSNFVSVRGIPAPTGEAVTSTTTNGTWFLHTPGFNQVRVRASTYTSGTATIYIRSSVNGGTTLLANVPKVASAYTSRSDTYTAAANGVTVDVTAAPTKSYGLTVKGTGAVATAWDVRIEGSLDNVNFTQILQSVTATGDGVTVWTGASLSPAIYIRSRCASVILGGASNVVATLVAL